MRQLFAAGAAALALLAVAPASAAEFKVGDITVVDPWARATPGKPRNGGAYLSLRGGAQDDKLIAAHTDVAKRTEIHSTRMDNGVMKMFKVDGVAVPAGGMAMLKPGSYHVMMMKLKHALKEGESFPLTLEFAKAGKVTVDVRIKAAGAMGMKHGGHGHGHGKMKMKK